MQFCIIVYIECVEIVVLNSFVWYFGIHGIIKSNIVTHGEIRTRFTAAEWTKYFCCVGIYECTECTNEMSIKLTCWGSGGERGDESSGANKWFPGQHTI